MRITKVERWQVRVPMKPDSVNSPEYDPKDAVLSGFWNVPKFVIRLTTDEGIAGIGETVYTKASGRTVLDLASEACLKAANDAGVALEDVDGIVSFHFNDSVPATAVATSLGNQCALHFDFA